MHRTNGAPAQQPPVLADRDRLEIIRFRSDEAERQAIGVLRERGMLNLSSHRLDEWVVRTAIVRKLKELGVPFEWLTEGAEMPRNRRTVNLHALEEHAARVKLRDGLVLPQTRRKTVALPRESFIPMIQAEVGAASALLVYRYRVLVPLAQVIRDSSGGIHHVEIATNDDIQVIRKTLIRHFGGVTLLHQPPAPAIGIGSRDPADARTLEENDNIAFEVYAAPIQESDDYFRVIRRELQDALQKA